MRKLFDISSLLGGRRRLQPADVSATGVALKAAAQAKQGEVVSKSGSAPERTGDFFRPLEPEFMGHLRSYAHIIVDRLDHKMLLGGGGNFTTYALDLPGLTNLVVRLPKWGHQQLRAEVRGSPDPVQYLNQGTQWAARDNIGLAVAVLGESAAVLKKVEGKPCTHFFFDPLDDMRTQREGPGAMEKAAAVKLWASNDDFDSKFPLHQLTPAEKTFRDSYMGYARALAALPQSSYNEVAEIMREGYEDGRALDLEASNIHLIPAAPERGVAGRFGFVKETSLTKPKLSDGTAVDKMDMSQFAKTLFVDSQQRLGDRDLLLRRLVGAENREELDACKAVVMEKCIRAAEVAQLYPAIWARKAPSPT